MTTGATGQLGLALPVQGELSGTWGDTVNNGITQYTNIAIAGTLTLTGDGAVTLANTTGDASASNITSTLAGAGTVTAQFAIVRVTGTLTVAKVVTGPSYSKTYTVVNAATGGIVTFKASGQTGVSVAVGESAFVYFNGTDYVKIVGTATAGAAGGSNTQVQFNSSGILSGSANLTFNGTTLTANTIGAFTLGGTVSGGGNQINNVIIGTTTPLAGAFTTLSATKGSAGLVAFFLSGNSAQSPFISFGRAAEDVRIQIAATTNDLFTGTVAGDYATNSNASIWFGTGGNPITKISSTGLAVTGLISATGSITGKEGSFSTNINGATVLSVTDSGTSVNQNFDVNISKGGGAYSYIRLRLNNTDDIFSYGSILSAYAANLTLNSPGSGTIQLQINGSNKFVVGSAGQFGIGATPSYGTSGQVLTSGGSGAAPTWTTIGAAYSATALIIAGGGGGGYAQNGSGGGGAGGYIETTVQFAKGSTYTVTVGAGGAGANASANPGSDGGNSSVGGIASLGGGGGAAGAAASTPDTYGRAGGSGGGTASGSGFIGTGTAGQGNNGGYNDNLSGSTTNFGGAGGGGAGAVGNNASQYTAGGGGNGLASSITGSSVTRGGGGGGGHYEYFSPTPAPGGSGGGGDGSGSADPTAGTANTGGGGGGGGAPFPSVPPFNAGAAGGSGVVILSIPTALYSGTTTGSPTVTTSGANTILTFNASGSYTA